MTMKIEIGIVTQANHPEHRDAGWQVEEMLGALGFSRKTAAYAFGASGAYDRYNEHRRSTSEALPAESVSSDGQTPQTASTNVPEFAEQGPKVPRQRGQPSEGRKRRTKEEIAEDEAADAADAAGAPKTEAPAPQSSSLFGNPDAAQDRADETAETAGKTALTIDDVRQAVGRYQKVHGIAAAISNFVALVGKPLADLTDADFAGAIEKLDAAAAEAPAEPEPEKPEPEKPAEPAPAVPKTVEDVKAVILAYMAKFDGPKASFADTASCPNAAADMPKIFTLVCGDGVSKLSQVPVEKYGEIVAAFEEAITIDPFKRGAKS